MSQKESWGPAASEPDWNPLPGSRSPQTVPNPSSFSAPAGVSSDKATPESTAEKAFSPRTGPGDPPILLPPDLAQHPGPHLHGGFRCPERPHFCFPLTDGCLSGSPGFPQARSLPLTLAPTFRAKKPNSRDWREKQEFCKLERYGSACAEGIPEKLSLGPGLCRPLRETTFPRRPRASSLLRGMMGLFGPLSFLTRRVGSEGFGGGIPPNLTETWSSASWKS